MTTTHHHNHKINVYISFIRIVNYAQRAIRIETNLTILLHFQNLYFEMLMVYDIIKDYIENLLMFQ